METGLEVLQIFTFVDDAFGIWQPLFSTTPINQS